MTNQKGFSPILLVILVAILGIGGYFVYINYSSSRTKTDLQNIVNFNNISPTEDPNPEITTPKSSPSPTNLPSNTKVINYSIPQGWKTIQNQNGTFEISYDPNQFSATLENDEIFLSFNKTLGFAYIFSLKPYNGGSRHQLLKDLYGDIIWEKTYEKNYLVNGRSSLVMYNVDLSMSVVAGMVPADSKIAFVLVSSYVNESMTEKIIGTLKLLK